MGAWSKLFYNDKMVSMNTIKKILFLSFVVLPCLGFTEEVTSHDLIREATEAYHHQNWGRVTSITHTILRDYPESPFATDALYLFGVANYKKGNFDVANRYLTSYLKNEGATKYFEEAIKTKFMIAKDIYEGKGLQLLGKPHMPRTRRGHDIALALFEEVVTTLPRHEVAAQSLFYKAKLLVEIDEYKEAIESYETLIRRFPKHVLAPDSYLEIGKIYIARCQSEFADPDLLDLAKINYNRFEKQFPTEPRLRAGKLQLREIQEVLSSELYDIAAFYERTKKKQAAQVYYSSIINRYPETVNALKAKKRLLALKLSVLKQGQDPAVQEKIRDTLAASDSLS